MKVLKTKWLEWIGELRRSSVPKEKFDEAFKRDVETDKHGNISVD